MISILIAGPQGAGKTTIAHEITALLERAGHRVAFMEQDGEVRLTNQPTVLVCTTADPQLAKFGEVLAATAQSFATMKHRPAR